MDNSDLKKFIQDAKQIVRKFENALGWSCEETVSHNQDVVCCPFNKNHRLPEKKLKEHGATCKWRSYGYSLEESREIVEEESVPHLYPCINIDDVIAKVAPNLPPLRTYEMYVSTLTAEERLQVYDKVVEQMRIKQGPKDVSLLNDLQSKGMEVSKSNQDGNVPSSEVELKKEQRDHKRRRQTYRAKNVHITKRSQTEIFRDVLQVHMEELRQQWNLETNDESEIEQNCKNPTSRDQPTAREAHPKTDSRDRSHNRERSYEQRSREVSRSDRNPRDSYNRHSYHHREPCDTDNRDTHERETYRNESRGRDTFDSEGYHRRSHERVSRDTHYRQTDHRRLHHHSSHRDGESFKQSRERERPRDVKNDDVAELRDGGKDKKKKKRKHKDSKKHSKKLKSENS